MRLLPYKRSALDKLKFVFAVDDIEPYARSITMTLKDMVKAKRATNLSTSGKGHRNRFRVPIGGTDSLIIEINPNRPDHALYGLSMEYNPAHIQKSERQAVVDIVIEILGSNARELLSNVAVREVHVAVDFEIQISEVAFEARDKKSSGAWGKTFNGKNELQTLYFGSKQSGSQFTAYDKNAELHAQLARLPTPTTRLERVVDKASQQGPRLRVEDRKLLSRVPMPLHRLAEIPAPFEGFHIYAYREADEKLETPLERQTLALAKAVGLQAALAGLGKTEREAIRRKLAKCMVEWWTPAVYVGVIEKCLKQTGLFPEEAFDSAERRKSPAELSYRARKEAEKNRLAKGKPDSTAS